MSAADQIYIDTCKRILEYGQMIGKDGVRAHWGDDGSPAYTKHVFGVMNTYDLSKEFPAITLRRIGIKSAIDEILWIYQKKSNNVNQLNSHIWDDWADPDGSIGKAYGYQIAQKFVMRDPNPNVVGNAPIYVDQMDAVLESLKYEPFSRRIITNIYNHRDLYEMNLHPCCYMTQWNAHIDDNGEFILDMLMYQRSSDTLTAGNWNVVQYAALLMMVAQVSNMKPGKLIHVIGDAHIYDRHIDIVKELITRKKCQAPTVTLDPSIKNFYSFTPDSFNIEYHGYGEDIKFDVAI